MGMQVLGIVGHSDSGKTTLVERLVERCAGTGRVATVKHCSEPPDVDIEGKDTARHRSAGAAETVALTDDGDWFATGESRTLTDTLDALAPAYDYAFVEGYSGSSLPKVVLGDREAADPVIARFDSGASADLEARDGVHAVRLHHQTGVVEAGEDIVFVVVLAGHREEAFETVSDGIDRLKAEVPLFKKEVTVEEAFWVHERAS